MPNNETLQAQLQGILERLGEEETQRLAEAGVVEKEVNRARDEKARFEREVTAWEMKWVFLRKKDGTEEKVFCRRVGRNTLKVHRDEEGLVDMNRADLSSVVTPEERLLEILDQKIACTQRHGYRRLDAVQHRLEVMQRDYVANRGVFEKEMKNLLAFRARVFDTLRRKGFTTSS